MGSLTNCCYGEKPRDKEKEKEERRATKMYREAKSKKEEDDIIGSDIENKPSGHADFE